MWQKKIPIELQRAVGVNPCPAELFQLHFSSFEVGIRASYDKIYDYLCKNKHVWKLTFWLTENLSQFILWISVSFYCLLNLLESGYIRLQQHNG